MRHILVDNALAASGDCLLELSAFVAEDKCQTIQLPRKHHRSAICKLEHLINGLCFIRREHRFGMAHRRQFFQDLSGNSLSR